jgi:general secretion pathway protein F
LAAFEYIALNTRGREEKGVLEADSIRQVRQLLRDKGLTPLDVNPTRQKEGKGSSDFFANLFKPTLSVNERALVTRQLATLIGAGLPVEEALLAVSRQSEKPAIHSMMLTVRSRVMEGFSLANSLAEYPRAFPSLHRATVAAGESAGHLDLVLNRLADFTETQQESAAKVKQALIYPVILFVLTVVILAGLLGYVVPDIVKVFAESDQELPWLTTMIISISEFVVSYGFLVLLLFVMIYLGIRRLLKIPEIRLAYDRRLLSLPIIGKLSRGTNTSQFASTLSILSSSGVPLVEAMKIAGEVLSNTWLRRNVGAATEKVSEGSSLSSALDSSGYFPPMMLHMIASGESSGELDDMLSRVARHQQQDADMLMSVLLSLFGPLMLIVMGGAVFTIVMAILLPIINLNQLVV